MLSGTAPDRGARPATFGDVLVIPEFRAIYAASSLSWLGDYVARAAVTSLIFQATHSAAASAAAFAISYAPWLLGGSLLVSLAERYPYRTVMVICDVVRMVLMAAAAWSGLPLLVVPVLLLVSSFFSPPFDAARSATLPAVLSGDKYVVGMALHGATAQPAQVTGYFLGAAIAASEPRWALLINAATFAGSALFVRFGVRLRDPALPESRRTHLLRETIDGFRLVFATPALRALVLLVFCGSLFAVVPEGLGAAWADRVASEPDVGFAQGVIMAAVPLGSIVGALAVSRLLAPPTRRQLLRPLAIATPLALVPSLFDPSTTIIAAMAFACGFCIGGLVPVANGEFVRALPNAYRARAFGVVQGGLQLLQGSAVIVTGALAYTFPLPTVVGLWSLGGVGLMLLLSLSWPAQDSFAEATATAARLNGSTSTGGSAGMGAEPRASRPVTGAPRLPTPAPAPGTMEP